MPCTTWVASTAATCNATPVAPSHARREVRAAEPKSPARIDGPAGAKSAVILRQRLDEVGARGMAEYSKDVSPVGWYVGSYQLRFVELEAPDNDDPDAEFTVWENTVIVKADSFAIAYEKVVAVGMEGTSPYKGGDQGIPVQWIFEGVTELLPIYEPLDDGAEIMWAEHPATKLTRLRQRARSLEDLRQRLDQDAGQG